jgi:nitronate monooxygenase
MIDFSQLPVPVVQAPMAGGVSRPALVQAVAEAGGLGFLAGGYLRAEALRDQIDAVRGRVDGPFGVNLFVPEPPRTEVDLRAYRQRLQPVAERYGVTVPEPNWADDDFFGEKVEMLLEERIPAVSFTFGMPEPKVIEAFRAGGSTVIVTVTTAEEARAAVNAGADALCVQGPEAGGHRSTHRMTDEPGRTSLVELLRDIRVGIPVIAAGGMTTGADIAVALAAGATAVQLGTAFLRSDESGAKQPHKDALADPRFTDTAVTRAFTGRPARALRTTFVESFDDAAPAVYPQLHQLTAPIRAAAAAAGEADNLALWAGTGYRHARTGPAADIVEELWRQAVRLR